MKRSAMLIAISVIAILSLPAVGLAQQPPANPRAPMTGMKPDRVTADAATRKAMREKEAALRRKRTQCRQQARAQKIALLKRAAFVNECMAR